MNNYLNSDEIPMGLGMALAQNVEAMAYFTNLSKERQKQIINYTHQIKSKQEMKQFVQNLNSMF